MGGSKEKERSKHIYRLQLYGFSQLLGITGLNLSLTCPLCASGGAGPVNAVPPMPHFLPHMELTCTYLCPLMTVAPNAVFTKCTSEMPCIAPPGCIARGSVHHCVDVSSVHLQVNVEFPSLFVFEWASTTVFSVDRCN